MINKLKKSTLWKCITWISIILPIVQVIFLWVNKSGNYSYARDAEVFYGIPRFYFSEGNQESIIIKLIYVSIVGLILCSPILIRRFEKGKVNMIPSIIYSILIVFMNFMVISEFCDKYLDNRLKIIEFGWIPLIICIAISIASFIMYVYMFRAEFYFGNDRKENETVENNLAGKNRKTSNVYGLFIFLSGAIIFMYVLLVGVTTGSAPSNIRKYEIIKINDSKYRVVLTYHKELAVTMDCKIENVKNTNRGNYEKRLKFNKGHYKLDSIKGKDIIYDKFDIVTGDY